MTRFSLTAAVLVAGVLLWSSSANANMITITGGVLGQSMPMLASGSTGMVNLPATTIGNVSVSGGAVGSPVTKPGTFITDVIAVKSGGGGAQTIIVSFTEQDLTSGFRNVEFTSGFTSNFIATGWSATLTTFFDPTNGVAPSSGSVLLSSFPFAPGGPANSGPLMTTVPVGTGPFSLQEVYRIASPSGNATNNTANLTIDLMGMLVVPEPGTLALLGTGLVAIGGVLRRRR